MIDPTDSSTANPSSDSPSLRSDLFAQSQTIIVKIGSNVLARDDDTLDVERIAELAEQVGRLIASRRKVIVVSSGAVAAGLGILRLDHRPQSLPELQAAAASGQTHLMKTWGDAFERQGLQVAQLLLTIDDFRHRTRYLNVRNTVRALFDFGLTPIINENDSISVDEIAVGDNDQLASMIATLVPRPLMVILSSIDGLFDGCPELPESQLISTVEQPGEFLLKHVSGKTSSRGRGGMGTKLKAILNAVSTGESVILANGRVPGILDQIAAGKSVGTVFLAKRESVPAWKRWIGLASQPEGQITVDEGAASALTSQGRSLLAVGIREVSGKFEQGASVEIAGQSGLVIARGLVNYSSEEIRSISGRKSKELPAILGHVPYGEVVHRDNMMLVEPN